MQSTRPGAGEIPQVTSLAQLRALPAGIKAQDWEVRVGWAESGIEGSPWRLLYAHYRYVGAAAKPGPAPPLPPS